MLNTMNFSRRLGLAILFLWQLGLPPAGACPELCFCAGTMFKMVDCYGRQLTEIPEGLPADVTNLDLQGNSIIEIDPNKLMGLEKLLSLQLTLNQITTLGPDDLKNLTNLIQLNLAGNQVDDIDEGAFQHTPGLEVLVLKGNQITNISGRLDNLHNLERLDLSKNLLTTIQDDDFNSLGKLTLLDLSANQIAHLSSAAMQHLTEVTYIRLGGNPLSDVNGVFGGLSKLISVSLTECGISEIPKGLPPQLKTLWLGKNELSKIPANAFVQTPRLNKLYLNDNQITSFENDALKPIQQLEVLSLNNNRLRGLPTSIPKGLKLLRADFNAIVHVIPTNFMAGSKLVRLSLNANNISEVVGNTFSYLGSLISLSLSKNNITRLHVHAFNGLHRLTTLALDGNPITQMHSETFSGLQRLSHLTLSNITNAQIDMTDNVFRDASSLSSLDVSNSPAIAARILSSAELQHGLRSLRRINLSKNNLVTLPVELRNGLPRLRSLQLANNPWRCDKDLLDLRRWMQASPKDFRDRRQMVCDSPEHLKGRVIIEVPQNEFILLITTPKTTTVSTTFSSTFPGSTGITNLISSGHQTANITANIIPESTDHIVNSTTSVSATKVSHKTSPQNVQPTSEISSSSSTEVSAKEHTATSRSPTIKTSLGPSSASSFSSPPPPPLSSSTSSSLPSSSSSTFSSTQKRTNFFFKFSRKFSTPSQPTMVQTSTSAGQTSIEIHSTSEIAQASSTSSIASKMPAASTTQGIPVTNSTPTSKETTKNTSTRGSTPTKLSKTTIRDASIPDEKRSKLTTSGQNIDISTKSPISPQTVENKIPSSNTSQKSEPSKRRFGNTDDFVQNPDVANSSASPGSDTAVMKQSIEDTSVASSHSNINIIIISVTVTSLIIIIEIVIIITVYKYRQRQKRLLDNALPSSFPAESSNDSVLIIENMAVDNDTMESPVDPQPSATMTTFKPGRGTPASEPETQEGDTSMGKDVQDKPPKQRRSKLFSRSSSSSFDCMGLSKGKEDDKDVLMESWEDRQT